MSNTRRSFLQASAAWQRSRRSILKPTSRCRKMKFGGAEISRMVLGVNPFYGFAHYNNNFGAIMKEWYTQDRVCDIMHQCNRYGINAFNYVHMDRAPLDWRGFRPKAARCT